MTRIARDITRFTRTDIDYAFAHGKRILKSSSFDIIRAPRKKEFGRILIIVPKKVGSAPERNLVRRRLKSIFYEEKLYTALYDYIFIVKKNVTVLSFQEMKTIVLGTLTVT
ncbi:MAG TPA: ribonuclease P protein component [Candidatus Bathyarchaeia archaeon]|nr:ribonuclease P protein component [Candidatus Bathyarchaeia archaeon]